MSFKIWLMGSDQLMSLLPYQLNTACSTASSCSHQGVLQVHIVLESSQHNVDPVRCMCGAHTCCRLTHGTTEGVRHDMGRASSSACKPLPTATWTEIHGPGWARFDADPHPHPPQASLRIEHPKRIEWLPPCVASAAVPTQCYLGQAMLARACEPTFRVHSARIKRQQRLKSRLAHTDDSSSRQVCGSPSLVQRTAVEQALLHILLNAVLCWARRSEPKACLAGGVLSAGLLLPQAASAEDSQPKKLIAVQYLSSFQRGDQKQAVIVSPSTAQAAGQAASQLRPTLRLCTGSCCWRVEKGSRQGRCTKRPAGSVA